MSDNIKVTTEKIKRLPLSISTECVCDLPFSMIEKHNVELIYYYISTEHGVFRDRDEISPENVFEHMDNGGQKAESEPPSSKEYEKFFKEILDKYERVIHICLSSGIANAYQSAMIAKERLGKIGERIDIVDSYSLSSGMGLLVDKACEMRDNGVEATKIVRELNVIKYNISTTFIMHDFLYFYLNDRVSLRTVKICNFLNIHPVIRLKNGKMKLGWLFFGNFTNCATWYVKFMLRNKSKIDMDKIFVTHASCSVKLLNNIKQEIDNIGEFNDVIINKASATVSSNCGPNTFGVLCIRNK